MAVNRTPIVAQKKSVKKRFVGNNTTSNSNTCSALKVALYKKSVLHIDNIANDITDADIRSFLQGSELRVVSCFKAKS